jgi:hypothetical protein
MSVNEGSEDEYYESLGPGKGIYATIDRDGMIEFKINTEGAHIRGTDLFNKIMQHFEDRVAGVWGMWPTGANLNRVNELTAQGIPLEVAVTRTWSANRARAFGFNKAFVIGEPVGTPGAYTRLLVKFVRD